MFAGGDETSMSAACQVWTGVSGCLPGTVCCVENVVVFVAGGGVSGRSSCVLVGV